MTMSVVYRSAFIDAGGADCFMFLYAVQDMVAHLVRECPDAIGGLFNVATTIYKDFCK